MSSPAEQQLAILKMLKEKLEKTQPRTPEIDAALKHHEAEIALLEKELELAKGR
jgi:hypothetical protein